MSRGTDPLTSDSDGDGLTDAAELNGALYTYNTGKQTRIYTDPRNADSDGDGISDGAELKFGYNPRATDTNPFGFGLNIDDADGIVKPGASFRYNAKLTYTRPPSPRIRRPSWSISTGRGRHVCPHSLNR